MGVLLIRLAGPMQSWGTQSRFTVRETATEPSKSGVIGLLCAAAGTPRADTVRIGELAALEMQVRVDREGKLMRDFHTAGGGTWPGRPRYGVRRSSDTPGDTVLSERYYLADADFLVALAGPDRLLKQLHDHLGSPVWPLYLGRKSFVPGVPVQVPDGLRDGSMRSVLTSYPWVRERDTERLRIILECGSGEGSSRLDVPVCFEPRLFSIRHVRVEWVATSNLRVVAEEGEHVPLTAEP
jgi:CRISPR system Cascade subunit CasD